MQERDAYELHNGKSHATCAADLEGYYVSAQEAMCKNDNGTACDICGGKIYISYAVLRRFKRSREALGSVVIGSGYRCHAHQSRLYEQSTQAERDAGLIAFPGNSPHEFGEALDLHTPAGYTPRHLAQFVLDTNKGDLRVGVYSWGIHIDTMFFVKNGMFKGIDW